MIRSFLLPTLALVLGSGCASSGGDGSGGPTSLRVSLIGYGSNSFELVSTSHTGRLEFYSQERGDASTKVQADEVMQALVERLEDLGFEDYAHEGGAPDPEGGGGVVRRAIEIERNGIRSWWALAARSSGDEKVAFSTAMRDFLKLFNATQGFQSVTNEEGGEYFDGQKRVRRD